MESAQQTLLATGEAIGWHDFPVTFGETERYFDIHRYPVRTVDGEIIGTGVVVVETTGKVKSRKELERGYQRELLIADTLQSALLGVIPERMRNLRLETVYCAAMDESRVGGDFYDVFETEPGKIVIVIGDVSGKGLKAAVQVAMAKYSLRSRVVEGGLPSKLLEQVNATLLHDTDTEGFVTIFVGVCDCSTNVMTYANGGHAPVFLWRADRQAAELIGPTGLLVGALEDAKYRDEVLQLQVGDELFLGTDGLFEVNIGGRLMEIEDLLEIYTDLKLKGQDSASMFVDRVSEFCGGAFRDDIAVLRVTVME
jgi:sigma-B regulation protein RsbU (phosphoserine phosphatase)